MINAIGNTQSFKGLWTVETSRHDSTRDLEDPFKRQGYSIQKTYTYHPFADEKKVNMVEKGKFFRHSYTCDEYNDVLDRTYEHDLTTTAVLGNALNITSKQYYEALPVLKEIAAKSAYMTQLAAKTDAIPKSTDFGYSEYPSDYSQIQKIY